MNTILERIRCTSPLKHMVVPRYAAGAALGIFGALHLSMDQFSMMPILEAAHLPLAGISAVVVPILEVIAGVMLVSGLLARVGAALAVPIMVVAIYAHIVADWPGEVPFFLPLVVLGSSVYVLWLGAGAWSVDCSAVGTCEPEMRSRPKVVPPTLFGR